MGKIQTVSIPQFMTSGFPPRVTAASLVGEHWRKHHKTYIQITGIAVSVLIMGAADPSVVTAATGATGIDIKAHHIYDKLCLIGKWIIVVRGGIDIISSMSQGELDSMKKKIVAYIVGYVALLGLPWILDQASLLFDGTSI